MSHTRVIVVGNEKGGAGKSTIAIHIAVGLMHEGARVAVLDLDTRQQSSATFFTNRLAWAKANRAKIPKAILLRADTEAKLARLKTDADVLVIDTPGADTALSRAAHQIADQVVTPMNDSFVDFGMLGVVDPVTLEVTKPSLYAETVWEARKARALRREPPLDWVVLRNRLASVEPRNRRRVDERLGALSKRIGFRVAEGLRDRVIYRELFPFGVTVSDLTRGVRPVPVGIAHVVARQELRALLHGLGLVEAPEAVAAAPVEEEVAA